MYASTNINTSSITSATMTALSSDGCEVYQREIAMILPAPFQMLRVFHRHRRWGSHYLLSS